VRSFTPSQGLRSLESILSQHICRTGVIDVSDWTVLKNITRLGPYLDNIKVLQPIPETQQEDQSVLTLKYLQTLSPSNARTELDNVVRTTLKRTLGLGPSEVIDEAQQFSELGVDSLMTMELRNSLQKRLEGLAVSVHSIQENCFLKAFVDHLLEKIAVSGNN